MTIFFASYNASSRPFKSDRIKSIAIAFCQAATHTRTHTCIHAHTYFVYFEKNANYPHFLQAFLLKIEIYALRHIPTEKARGCRRQRGRERVREREGERRR